MWPPEWLKSVWSLEVERRAAGRSRRDRLAMLLALATAACLGLAFFLSKGTQFLMPGQLVSAHGGIEKCSACHTQSGSGKLSWIHGLVAGDPLADSKACLTCHKMPNTAFNAHGASADVLKRSTERLIKVAAETPAPQSARVQDISFPARDVVTGGLACATCHQEHQGVNFNLSKISNEQCRSCHVVKFDSFDGHHPQFDAYPFKKRTRIIYDHAGHFGKHFPDVAKKDPARQIPATCSTCHNSRENRRVMAVAPFEQTCTGCHLDQIVGKERVSGPKGIAFLSLPGLDLATLKKKNAAIGEWPEASEAELTPFMKVMIGRDERGRALMKTVDSLNLLDLSHASDNQLKAVTQLAWEIKGLLHALISGKASAVLGDLNIGGGAKLSATLVADLTASIPRDVVISAQQQWLPNLAAEMANRPVTSEREQSGWNATITGSNSAGSASPEEPSGSPARIDPNGLVKGREDGSDAAKAKKADEPEGATAKTYTVNAGPDDGDDPSSADEHGGATNSARVPLPSGTPRAIEAGRNKNADKATRPAGAAGKADTAKPDRSTETAPTSQRPQDKATDDKVTDQTDTAKAKAEGGIGALPSTEQPQGKTGEQTDDLLFPTEDELRAIKSGGREPPQTAQRPAPAAKADTDNAKPDGAASAADAATKADANAPADSRARADISATKPQTKTAPVISIDSDVDPESWADYGGWYRQDYAIFYRPTGHKDKFIYSWLFLTGPQAPKGETSPPAAVFDFLTSKDAQGSCTKCHSVDDIQGGGRVVNFAPASVESKRGRFTNFIHEPHFGIMENRGCLTCHSLEKGSPYLKSYEQGNAQIFASNFGAVKKDLCQTCHTSSMASQDCLLCHSYHVNGAVTPIMSTKNPTQ